MSGGWKYVCLQYVADKENFEFFWYGCIVITNGVGLSSYGPWTICPRGCQTKSEIPTYSLTSYLTVT
jgi:hypothetical protein